MRVAPRRFRPAATVAPEQARSWASEARRPERAARRRPVPILGLEQRASGRADKAKAAKAASRELEETARFPRPALARPPADPRTGSRRLGVVPSCASSGPGETSKKLPAPSQSAPSRAAAHCLARNVLENGSGMLASRFRIALLLAALAGAASCEINPQPPLPNSPSVSNDGQGASSGGTGGAINLDTGGSATEAPTPGNGSGGRGSMGAAGAADAAGGDGGAGIPAEGQGAGGDASAAGAGGSPSSTGPK